MLRKYFVSVGMYVFYVCVKIGFVDQLEVLECAFVMKEFVQDVKT